MSIRKLKVFSKAMHLDANSSRRAIRTPPLLYREYAKNFASDPARTCNEAQNFNETKLKLILPLPIKQLERAIIICLRDKHLGRPIQIPIIRLTGIHKLLRRDDAVLLEHHHQHLRIDNRPGIKQFHARSLTTNQDCGQTRLKTRQVQAGRELFYPTPAPNRAWLPTLGLALALFQ